MSVRAPEEQTQASQKLCPQRCPEIRVQTGPLRRRAGQYPSSSTPSLAYLGSDDPLRIRAPASARSARPSGHSTSRCMVRSPGSGWLWDVPALRSGTTITNGIRPDELLLRWGEGRTIAGSRQAQTAETAHANLGAADDR